ncbi:hypothetical protein Dvina_01970 [Dactylosporangium vinaceum]|uniref:Integral membrane protein n=1 Tax=Dactylosporangium vinaceum TaxID=53362 RepID=A0ABV5MF46_9ACTN|nr:hypothetical protein [Dactylosporangium vinaceum]UAB97003.1 hypothetical protein Dvina_01970 [Dactylosporangium vinaceum]
MTGAAAALCGLLVIVSVISSLGTGSSPGLLVATFVCAGAGGLSCWPAVGLRRSAPGARGAVYVLAFAAVGVFVTLWRLPGLPIAVVVISAAVAVSRPSARRWLTR